MSRAAGFVVALGLLMFGCGESIAPDEPVATRLDGPAGPESGQPQLQVAGDSAVWLSWVAPTDSGHALRYAALADEAWSPTRTVATGADWFVNWADLPSVVPLPEGRAAAHFLQNNHRKMDDRVLLAYDVRVTQRSAAGDWSAPATLHNDSTQTEHGFVSMVPWGDNRLLAVWLDGRKMTNDGGMTLRGAVLGPDGTVARRNMIDGRTCECCATSTVRVGDEALVAYRDRSETEVRDIRLVRFDGTEWSEPRRLHADGWKIGGCPVNGPALAAEEDRVVAAWFTAAEGRPRVRAAVSSDAGHEFSSPVDVGAKTPEGRVDAVFLDDGTAVVSWLESTERGGAVRGRPVFSDGTTGPVRTLVRLSSASRAAGFPKMVHRSGRVYLAWVQPGGEDAEAQVQVARTPVDRIL